VLHRLNSAATLIQRTTTEAPRDIIGLDVHKKTISYCVKDESGQIQQEGKVGSTRRELDCWMAVARVCSCWFTSWELSSRSSCRTMPQQSY
jgi:hypothetical protein